MAKGYLGLEIGDKILRFVYLTKQKGHYVLSRAGEMEANLNFTITGALTQAVRMIIEKEELLPSRVFVTISRKDVLIHQQLMPKMSASELAEVVPGEIEKIPYFYNQNFEYSYTAFMHSKEKDRVLLVAVAQEFLKSMIDEIDATKIPFRDIEISPLNLKDILRKAPKKDQCEAVLVVQEMCSYFFIFRGGIYLGVYRSPIGSQQVNSPINAHHQEQMFSNWIAEFGRVNKSHSVEHPSMPIEKLWIVANRSLSFKVASAISQFLDIAAEVVSVDSIPELEISEQVEWDPIYANALTPVMLNINARKPIFALDHFFAKFQMQKYVMLLMVKSLIFLFVLIFGMGAVNFFVKNETANLTKETRRMNLAIHELNEQNKHLFQQKNEYLEVRHKLLAQAGYVKEINRTSWTTVLAAIATELPTELSLTGFKFNEAGDVQIKGDTFDITHIAELIRKVDQSSILEGGKFEFLRERKQQEVKLFNFGIQANLRGKKEANNGQK